MKNSRICPKCGCTDIIIVPGNVDSFKRGNNIMTGFTVLSAVFVHRYVCGSCGYSEEWISERDLQTLKKKYQK